MKYSDLVQFEPVESVIQLTDADQPDYARGLVETYVISNRMAEQLSELVMPQLQFTKPADNKGLMIVGNYGTGKSHLMGVLSAVAEHAELVEDLTHPSVRETAEEIGGKFKVIRAEIGAVEASLRDIIMNHLERGLDDLGVPFTFPDAADIPENKTSFAQMMAVFQEEYPDRGLLLVLDELLDYLRSRKEQELVLDLNFLREIGEVCKNTRFRFIAGIQESLFDNPRFQFVAESLTRVKDRFAQVRIIREDVAYVVAQRLLKKNDKQRSRIEEHLKRFAPLYGSMNERMSDFITLFPVHPAYLETFERVIHAEKREVLKTLSNKMKLMIDDPVPDDEPGVIAYDSYWQNLNDNPAFRAVPEIKEVTDKARDLEARIKQSYTRPQYKAAAFRIIHALAVHRLTTTDIYTPWGVTAEELRDDLCLTLPGLAEEEAGFLKTMVETVLSEISKTVSGQYLSFNEENGQYYLDLKKDIDFDQLIEKRAETLDEGELDRHYFNALKRVVLEDPNLPSFVSGYRIWEHELIWRKKNAGRSGYLFFGAPNQRSTAQPPRDFYLYFLQPFDPPYFKDEKKPDEVFFKLASRDDEFDRALRLYGGATAQEATASGSNKKIYGTKADDQLKVLTKWLRENMTTAFRVIHEGEEQPLAQSVKGKVAAGRGTPSLRDFIDIAGSEHLASHFADQSPNYPSFSVVITRENREQAAAEALRWIGGSVQSKQGTAVLDGLDLLDGEKLRPRDSLYARAVLERLEKKDSGTVVNRSELIDDENGVEYWGQFRLEPEHLVVVLASLVHSGDLVLSIPGKNFDASSVQDLAAAKVPDLVGFKHIKRPQDFPVAPLKALFDLLEIPPGLVAGTSGLDEGVQQLQQRVGEEIMRVVKAQSQLNALQLWQQPLLSDAKQSIWRDELADWKSFLENLKAYNTPGKLKNFKHSVEGVAAQRAKKSTVRRVEELSELVSRLQPLAAYLSTAEAVLSQTSEWVERAAAAREDLIHRLGETDGEIEAKLRQQLTFTLQKLKKAYVAEYTKLHARARLNAGGEEKKNALRADSRLKALQALAAVDLTPSQELREFQNALDRLTVCYGLTEQLLDTNPVCPHCGYRPAEEAAYPVVGGLDSLDDRLEQMHADWTQMLLANLDDPTVRDNLDLIADENRLEAVQRFQEAEKLPDRITSVFVKALQEVFAGLERVEISEADLHAALTAGGMPCTPAEFRDRFESYVGQIIKGHDVKKTRILLIGANDQESIEGDA